MGKGRSQRLEFPASCYTFRARLPIKERPTRRCDFICLAGKPFRNHSPLDFGCPVHAGPVCLHFQTSSLVFAPRPEHWRGAFPLRSLQHHRSPRTEIPDIGQPLHRLPSNASCTPDPWGCAFAQVSGPRALQPVELLSFVRASSPASPGERAGTALRDCPDVGELSRHAITPDRRAGPTLSQLPRRGS